MLKDLMEVCPVARGVMLPCDATPIHAITAWPSLFPSSFTRSAIGVPCGCLPVWEHYGLTVFRLCNAEGVGPLFPPVAWDAHAREVRSPWTRYSACLAQACQHLWLVEIDDVYRAFTWVDPTLDPSPAPAWCCQVYHGLTVVVPVG